MRQISFFGFIAFNGDAGFMQNALTDKRICVFFATCKNYLSFNVQIGFIMRIVFSGFVLMVALFCAISCTYLPDALTGASRPMATDGNSLFHQTELVELTVGELTVVGEVKKPGPVNLDDFYQREVVVKEAIYDQDSGIVFIGAYRYRGYSLFDLLHPFNHQKKNAEEFRPAIDLYVIVENEHGESVTFSWSEIFHTNIPHQVVIATAMAPVVPYRREVDYPAGNAWRVVSGNDLFAYRMLDNPVRITVRSFDSKTYAINRDLKPLYSPAISVVFEQGESFPIEQLTDISSYKTYFTTFYGMGMGHHKTQTFSGPPLFDLLSDKIDPFDAGWISGGLVCFAGIDGYRAVFSFSELFNRTDQVAPILAVPENPEDGGFYRIFHPAEFYADRSVKSVQEIYFFKL